MLRSLQGILLDTQRSTSCCGHAERNGITSRLRPPECSGEVPDLPVDRLFGVLF